MDGKIHDKEYLKTPDRIRQSFTRYWEVHRVRNERIKSEPFAVGADLIQKYYEVADADDKTKIAKLKSAAHHESVPKDTDEKLQLWALEFNKELNNEE